MDVSKLSIEGQTLKELLNDSNKKVAKHILVDLEGLTVSEATLVLDYVREAIDCSEIR